MSSDTEASPAGPWSPARLRLVICGGVQGVGFRPFIFRLATELGLQGWVSNSVQGVFIEVEGGRPELETFLLRLEPEKPPRSFIQSLEYSWLDAVGYSGFEIRVSETSGAKSALVLPDIATCPDCLREIFDPQNRRFFYPFTNCTNCGPRFSIVEGLPYDRANTSMKAFTMCSQCQAEYDEPNDRRFHAQPNACPVCGPRLELWDPQGTPLASGSDPNRHQVLEAAAEVLRAGKILALKGLGGFQLLVDARDDAAVRRLRDLKHREEKPFALMFPSLEAVQAVCEVSSLEERLLRSPECPIVLLKRKDPALGASPSALAPSIAPGNPYLGLMLPYTPLHHLLLSLLGFPVVATSGNLSDEPICIEEHDALERLGGIADRFLVHNRPIVRHVDDSIVRVMAGRELVLRRARGYAPLPMQVRPAADEKPNVLAVGAHLKNTIALSVGPQVFISQHIGDLETGQAYQAFERVIADFQKLYESGPTIVAADAHPDYLSTKFARAWAAERPPRECLCVQHHAAHVFSCMAENELEPPVLGVSWDGTGYGLDGTVWGGEFFQVTETVCDRVAHLRPFRLPGGDQAVKEPRRTALGWLFAACGDAAFQMGDLAPVRACSLSELSSFKTMLVRGLNSPLTSSVGRLFDAVASLLGLRQQVRFEGQAAMELEFAIADCDTLEAYPLPILDSASPAGRPTGTDHQPITKRPSPFLPSPLLLDWSELVQALLGDLKHTLSPALVSAKFHNALVEGIVAVARRTALQRVVLSGGCFQNRYLTERAIRRLQEEGFRPYWHQRVPPNDGGICLGQIVAALRRKG